MHAGLGPVVLSHKRRPQRGSGRHGYRGDRQPSRSPSAQPSESSTLLRRSVINLYVRDSCAHDLYSRLLQKWSPRVHLHVVGMLRFMSLT